jgi:xylose isomerase
MKRKYAVMTGFLGGTQDRFAKYGSSKTIEEKFEMAARVKNCSGLEMLYPYDFENVALVKELLKKYSLQVAIINLNVKAGEVFKYGSFSSPEAEVRSTAVEYMMNAMDLAEEFGCKMITCAFLNDGSDYPFQFDYLKGWNNAVEAVREAADYKPQIKISLEYKACEPRVHVFLNNAGKMAYFCEKVGRDNVGVTLDTGHAFLSNEVPSDSLSFLYATNRLFYVHINDNYRNWDWDMIPGTVNFWEMLEFAFYLRRINYTGWITADVFPQRLDAVKTFEETFNWMELLFKAADKIDEKEMLELMGKNDIFAAQEIIKKILL